MGSGGGDVFVSGRDRERQIEGSVVIMFLLPVAGGGTF